MHKQTFKTTTTETTILTIPDQISSTLQQLRRSPGDNYEQSYQQFINSVLLSDSELDDALWEPQLSPLEATFQQRYQQLIDLELDDDLWAQCVPPPTTTTW